MKSIAIVLILSTLVACTTHATKTGEVNEVGSIVEPVPENNASRAVIASLEELSPASITELTIASHGSRMPGHIYQAAGKGPHPTAIMLHGYPGNTSASKSRLERPLLSLPRRLGRRR